MGTSDYPGSVHQVLFDAAVRQLEAERELAQLAADLAEERFLRIQAEGRAHAAELALVAAGRPLAAAPRPGAAA